MGMFDQSQAPGDAVRLAVSFLDAGYTMKPGETETGPIRVRVTAMRVDRSAATGYSGTATLSAQGEVIRLVNPVTCAVYNGTGEAEVRFTNLNPNFADPQGRLAVGVVAFDYANGIGGSSQSYFIQLAQAPAPVIHRWEFYNQGVLLGAVNIPNPEDVRIVRDGAMVYPARIF